jgi:succinate dehydrogenase / fumarate reductase cytochrome b subunit
MADAAPKPRNRPLSPHMQIWRWGPAMAISILHRATGNALAFAGLGLLLWWLCALASGAEAYASFTEHATAWYGWVVLVGLSWSFFNHMASGIRHFVLDIGAGFELKNNALWSVLTPVIGILLTAAFWALALN